ncbi:lipase maturation factor, putative [Plasmodium sp. gorilla clade G2]|uniref:lipase maturation factor, putative n=1 Tax=Plasmodium sp. gorilla clade G2 TaxID=880535 RepID=UPI000D21A4A7|nr:lipase maturation factor, putative [Plasmodium sp. gorilla clade G2]SOV13794.1 lipase maturation factor, putative [Plasmodium sp. gorilla clade G2]
MEVHEKGEHSRSYDNDKKYDTKFERNQCYIITSFIFFIFFLSTINNLDKYIHINTTRYILTYSNLLYLISFCSLHIQVEFLVGLDKGLLPVDKYLTEIKEKIECINLGVVKNVIYFVYSFWEYVIRKRIKIKTFCKLGILISVLNFLIQNNLHNDFFRIITSSFFFVFLFFLHICFKIVMRDFMIFQCDLLLNEFGFLLIFLNLSDSYYLKYSNTLIICILRLLSFKILFNSAVRKLVYDRKAWLNLDCFENFFFSQPVPSILSYIANCKFDKKLICFCIIVSEILFSWLVFCASHLRLFFFGIFVCIHITSYIICNYVFFSYICLVLFLSSFDDSTLSLLFPSGNAPELYMNDTLICIPTFIFIFFVNTIFFLFYLFIVFMNCVPFFQQWNIYDLKCFHFFYQIHYEFSCLNICNSYAMLTYTGYKRKEVVIEELHKVGESYVWKEVPFMYKPNDLNKIGKVLWWGHIPRLEWKFFFFPDHLKKEDYKKNIYPLYICSFLKKLCNRDLDLMSIFEEEQMESVPLLIRLIYYDYKMIKKEKNINNNNNMEMKTLNNKDKVAWDMGKYWQRKKIDIIGTLKYKKENK